MTSQDKVWYDRAPVGEKTIGSMMARISEHAQLSRRYTNHCLRATTVTLLDEAGAEGRHIVAITQHTSTASLASYSRVSEKRMMAMSAVISDALSNPKPVTPATITSEEPSNDPVPEIVDAPLVDDPVPAVEPAPPVVPAPAVDPIPAVADDPPADDSDDISPVPILSLSQHVMDDDIFPTIPTQQLNRTVFQPIFNNCNVNIHYNFKK